MPWRESGPMDERLQFVRDAQRDHFIMSELCARYGVSRRQRPAASTATAGRMTADGIGGAVAGRVARRRPAPACTCSRPPGRPSGCAECRPPM
jgi:hypothetical protein